MRFNSIITIISAFLATLLPVLSAPTPAPAAVAVAGGKGGSPAGDLVEAIIGIIEALSEADQNDRATWVRKILEGLGDKYPTQNAFIYHRFQGNFEWSVAGEPVEAEVQWHRKDLVGVTEYYYCVVFPGQGWLTKVKGDGGFLNWMWRGWWTRDGDKVTFRAP